MSIRYSIFIAMFIALLIGFFPVLSPAEETPKHAKGVSLAAAPRPKMDSRTFDEVMRLLKEYYFEDVDEPKLFGGAAAEILLGAPPQCIEALGDSRGMKVDSADALKRFMRDISARRCMDQDRLRMSAVQFIISAMDPNTSFMDREMLKELKVGTSGKFGGVGMVVNPKEGDYVVVAAFEGSPAHKAGIRAGETIVELDGEPLHGKPLMDVLRKVRGPAGSVMTLTLLDKAKLKTRQVKVHRTNIEIPPVRFARLTSNFAYLRILNFQETAAKEAYNALVQLFEMYGDNLQGLVLDLRDNPGGLFDEAIRIANFFTHSGRITSVIGKNKKLNREFSANEQTPFPEVPLVILINKGTASASEILTGALQGLTNVWVMGEQSFGKASVQAVFPLKQGGALRVTTAHYYTADGRNIDGSGISPDVPIEEPAPEWIDSLKGRHILEDPWIQQAIETLSAVDVAEKPPFETLY